MGSLLGDILGAVTGGLGIADIFSQQQAMEEEEENIKIEEQEAQVQSTEQSIRRGRRLRQIIGAAQAQEGARGVSLASPSFKAVQKSSFNRFNEDENAAALNLSFKDLQFEEQRSLIKDREQASMFGTALSTARDLAMFL